MCARTEAGVAGLEGVGPTEGGICPTEPGGGRSSSSGRERGGRIPRKGTGGRIARKGGRILRKASFSLR